VIAATAIIHPNVRLGRDAVVEDYCVIGCPPRGAAPGELETVIGDGAVIRSFTVIYAGNRIGRNFQTGNKANIRESNEIGDDVSVGTLSVVEHHVHLGDGVRIHTQAFVPEYSRLEKGSWVGPNVVFTNALYPLAPDAKATLRGPVLEEGARIGANATLLPGVSIGRNSLVGAGAVVTRDVPAEAVVAGNPARVVKSVRDLPYKQGKS
jgi:acetyltransferase-like isoleucine patch superfamily enzyme